MVRLPCALTSSVSIDATPLPWTEAPSSWGPQVLLRVRVLQATTELHRSTMAYMAAWGGLFLPHSQLSARLLQVFWEVPIKRDL
jgi:hypothetical protein